MTAELSGPVPVRSSGQASAALETTGVTLACATMFVWILEVPTTTACAGSSSVLETA